MTEQAPKKGMSKGCLIAIIVAVFIIALMGGLLWCQKDDIVKWGTVQLVQSAKPLVIPHADKIDTVQFNAVVDRFVTKFNNDQLDYDRFGTSFEDLRSIVADEKMSAKEAEDFLQMMIAYYPDLAELAPTGGLIETGMMDSTMTDSMMVEDSTMMTE